ncbi:nitrilase [Purpureocillium lilacinum]|uniref:Nitrilase n=1 Tax=Purpureocillium lilacinum TaxID=33203 RepID=A0A179HSZ8_PURLI|nr:nitrilase [Purpureocillium lilacinum]OAQ93487.1 nitrilase [Purpureocillium lilacinum]
MELDTDEEDEDEDDEEENKFEDIDFAKPLNDTIPAEPASLELNLTAHQATTSPGRGRERRKPITKEERERRIQVHQVHLLCLLCHISRRNRWCNDTKVQEALRPHLTAKTVNYLNPGANLSQFGQAESLKNGLKQAGSMWESKFEIRERGLRRALWAEDPAQLQDYEPPNDMDSCMDRKDFQDLAKKLQGSRDVGAQLYCALLRSAGVRARLVCSLQPLSFLPSAPPLPKPKKSATTPKSSQKERARDALAKYEALAESASAASPSSSATARRRLGHPNATAYSFTPVPSPPRQNRAFDTPVKIRESPYPVYWVEVLDVGHQKWQPVDPVVLHTFWKPKAFEPPITDKENCLSYVVAFEADGTARDVTRRYAKAYTAKTRRLRVENALEDGGHWWRKVMNLYRPKRHTDLDQIEDTELAGVEAREPMPRNVQDFKDHPVFALERHLRRHEVLVPGATPSGTVATGSRGPLERIFRRKDVRIAKSADKWYRLGREVKPNEIPVKWLPKRARPKNSRYDEEDAHVEDEVVGTPLYTEDQTELYEPPPVRNGRVPKNKFGNIEVYVPHMVPRGAVHIVHEHATRAALILGVDYAPALTGFEFKGRQGTAVLHGIIVASEFDEAIRDVINGLGDVQQELEDERKRLVALRMWRKLLMGLRIRERIWSGVDEEERREADRQAELDAAMANADGESDATDEFDMVVNDEDDDMAGGFLVD